MRTRARLFAPVLAALVTLAAGDSASARPGGGSSFGGGSKSSGSSSSRSSGSSSSRSSGSSTRSSGSSGSTRPSTPSSGSGSRRSTPSTPAPQVYTPVWVERGVSGRARALAASAQGGSPYPRTPSHIPVPIGRDTTDKVASAIGFVFGAGLFSIGTLVLTSPLILAAVLIKRSRKRRLMEEGWSTSAEGPPTALATEESPALVRRRMESIQATDPDFSVPLLEDFVAALYTEAHVARGAGLLERYSPYLHRGAREVLSTLPRAAVSTLIVGAMSPRRFESDPRTRLHRFVVEIEANYTETPPGGVSASFYAIERWTLVRAFGARSRPPARVRALTCPNCGAPLERSMQGRCGYCTQAVDSGQFDWVVDSIELLQRETRGPMLTGTTEEQGTEAATIFDPGLAVALARLRGVDPTFSQEKLAARVQEVFATMQRAWSTLQWPLARSCLTDRLWQSQGYWIEAYRQQALRNLMDSPRILGLELVRLGRDRWYEVATVRLRATGLDYTVRVSDGAVVGGSRTQERKYTEYWTLVRSATRPGASRDAPPCPSCGAPLAMQMAERCVHCGAFVESSTFDWVLSRIEQDEVYAG